MLYPPPQHAQMHRLFLIQELLSIICEHVRNEHSSIAGRTLASLARTSKAFHHVATNALWSQLNGLAPLLESLASDLTFGPEVGAVSPRQPLTLRRPLKMAEWETLRGLARRVQRLRVHDPTRPVDVSIVRILCNPPTTLPLFPNLKSFIWNDERADIFSFILTSLTINVSNDGHKWCITELGILASLPYVFPNVTQVTLPFNAFVNGVSSISEALCTWSNLTEIKCGEINGTALAHLAKQPALRKLSFNMPNNMRPGLDVSLPSGAFPCIRDFEIHAMDLSVLSALINRLEGSPVSLHVVVDTNPPPTGINSLFTTLSRFSSPQLQSLSLRLVTPSSPRVMPVHSLAHPHPQANATHYMAPSINMMSQPHSLSLHANAASYMAPISIMSQAHNSSLHAAFHAISSVPPPTFHTFTSGDFMPLTIFESLGRIEINVNHEVPSNRPGEGFENTAVRTLGLADSLIEARATVAVAAFLSDILPNLTTIVAWNSVTMSRRLNAGIYAERWAHVSEQVRGMNSIRKQERKWWMSDDEGESKACALSQV
ncbi:hypothetical protein DFH29DRAFT_1044244 [Suillus ampliporus]|nr:hypothetical protein DFH29DRAFT_1044244 [Suillus ampliporus]